MLREGPETLTEVSTYPWTVDRLRSARSGWKRLRRAIRHVGVQNDGGGAGRQHTAASTATRRSARQVSSQTLCFILA